MYVVRIQTKKKKSNKSSEKRSWKLDYLLKKKKPEKMIHQKKIKRISRRIVAMFKISIVMMFFIFTYGVIESNISPPERRRSGDINVGVVLTRHERMHYTSESRDSIDDETNEIVSKQPKLEILEETTKGRKLTIFLPDIDYNVILKKGYQEEEERNKIKWEKRLKEKQFLKSPPNADFIFHNKLPKSGSSTMNNILKVLSRQNKFNFLKMETSTVQASDDNYLIQYLQGKIKKPFLLLKHHRWLNFTRLNNVQPTYINVMRDPLEWFTSRYYFSRYGWKRKPGCRTQNCGMSEKQKKMEIDECVKTRVRECTKPWMYIQFFCGTSRHCNNITTFEQKKKATNIAKWNILNEYYVVGVLEQFEDTLNTFETLMPNYFKSVVRTWKSEFVQRKQNLTQTTYKKEMNEESKKFFREGPLYFETDLYNFARKIFNERMKRLKLESTVNGS